ncbi:hypothetical protein GW17_00048500 [Ensete ventricosum]|nr:hypothetical protein GW17_00048500 [Ensete ventricosum]
MGGCGSGILELRTLFPDGWVSDLVWKAEELVHTYRCMNITRVLEQGCSCFTSEGVVDHGNDSTRKAASRDDMSDNYLYCPNALDIQNEDLKHFQCHWIKGDPIIVTNVLETTPGLSWEPMVMWRAFRQITNMKHGQHLDVTAIDCLDLSEVFHTDLYRPYQAVCTGPPGYRYVDHLLSGGTVKIDRRRSIEGEKGKKKKKRKRRKKKKRRRRIPRAVAAHGSLMGDFSPARGERSRRR